MKKLRLISFSIICSVAIAIFYSCGTTASRALEKGQYDYAIQKCVSKLISEPSNVKHLEILQSAYAAVQIADNNEITSLLLTGNDDSWDGILSAYQRMANRSKMMQVLPSSVKSAVNFTYNAYASEINSTKQKAAEFNYQQGIALFNANTKSKYREAYNYFVKVQNYVGNTYKNGSTYLQQSRERGMTNVLYLISTNLPFDNTQLEFLYRVYPEQLNSTWVNYFLPKNLVTHVSQVDLDAYDFLITFNVTNASVSPVFADSYSNNYEKKIQDGTDYKVDANGKPVLDSAGNFIKVPKYVTLKCQVLETRLQKTATLLGEVKFQDIASASAYRNTQQVRQETIISSSTFKLIGDNRALPNDAKLKVENAANSLPPDGEIMRQCCVDASQKIRDVIYRYRGSIK
ncbi:MAG: hypothetical protein LBC89_06010 [Bacteroidales bacterium]|jgi:hypothetical protein|nr:hypothetical protein [Bacteroidales bacterium]